VENPVGSSAIRRAASVRGGRHSEVGYLVGGPPRGRSSVWRRRQPLAKTGSKIDLRRFSRLLLCWSLRWGPSSAVIGKLSTPWQSPVFWLESRLGFITTEWVAMVYAVGFVVPTGAEVFHHTRLGRANASHGRTRLVLRSPPVHRARGHRTWWPTTTYNAEYVWDNPRPPKNSKRQEESMGELRTVGGGGLILTPLRIGFTYITKKEAWERPLSWHASPNLTE